MLNPYTMLGGALAVILALGGAYIGGRMDGARIAAGSELKAEQAAAKERDRLQGEIDGSAERHAGAEVQRQEKVREIYHETERVVDRPVYRNVCVDADGVRLLDRAADLANSAGVVKPAGGTAAVAEVPANAGR